VSCHELRERGGPQTQIWRRSATPTSHLRVRTCRHLRVIEPAAPTASQSSRQSSKSMPAKTVSLHASKGTTGSARNASPWLQRAPRSRNGPITLLAILSAVALVLLFAAAERGRTSSCRGSRRRSEEYRGARRSRAGRPPRIAQQLLARGSSLPTPAAVGGRVGLCVVPAHVLRLPDTLPRLERYPAWIGKYSPLLVSSRSSSAFVRDYTVAARGRARLFDALRSSASTLRARHPPNAPQGGGSARSLSP
jgi:hypothetical protein